MTRQSEGASSSQSASSAVPSRLLLNCFPPFTFQVPTATRTGLKFVNSDWRSDMALRILGVTIGGHRKGMSGCTLILMHFPRTPRNPARPAAGKGCRGHPQGSVAVPYEDEAKSHHEQSTSLRSFCRKVPSTPFPQQSHTGCDIRSQGHASSAVTPRFHGNFINGLPAASHTELRL